MVLSLLLALLLLRLGTLDSYIGHFGNYGYVGAFILGFFFVSTFTVAPSAAAIFILARDLNPLITALLGGLGAMIGDYLAMRFIKDRLFTELNPILKALHIYRPVSIIKSPYFAWLAPVAGAIVIASPLPDELGLTLLGVTKISTAKFLALAFGLNSLGIFIIALAARA